MSAIRICLSNDPLCSGMDPCPACLEAILLSPVSSIMTRAMVAAGGPYTDPNWAAHFMQAFRESWRQTATYVRSELAARSREIRNPDSEDDAVETPRQPSLQTPDSQLPTPDEIRAAAQVEGVPLPETEDPDQSGYPIDPGAMAKYMSSIQKTEEKTTEERQQPLAISHQQEGESSQTTEVVTTESGPATTAGAEAE